jgi:hypothetical protein
MRRQGSIKVGDIKTVERGLSKKDTGLGFKK